MTHIGIAGADTLSLAIGDACPDFYLPPEGGVSMSLYETFCGSPVMLLFLSDPAELPVLSEQLLAAPSSWPIVILTDIPGVTPCPQQFRRPTIVAPLPGRLRERMFADRHENGLVFLDHRSRISGRLMLPAPHADLTRGISSTPEAPASRRVIAPAPILIVPEVLPADLCQQLINSHRDHNTPSGMPRKQGDRPKLIPDERFKRREDHALTDAGLINDVEACLSRNLLPAIAPAFHFRVTSHEGFKVVSYRASNLGYFRAHRDNISAETRHRRFGLSVNLNEGFDGGDLSFPEFGADTYCPPAGAAAVFSGSLLHQAEPVTAGRRYTLLSFLW